MLIARTDLIKGEPTSGSSDGRQHRVPSHGGRAESTCRRPLYVPFTCGVSALAAGHRVEIVYIIGGG